MQKEGTTEMSGTRLGGPQVEGHLRRNAIICGSLETVHTGGIIVKESGSFKRYPAPVPGIVLGGFHSLFHLI